MQRAGAGLRSIAEPVVDTTSDFAELVLAMLGVAAKLERRRILERTARGRGRQVCRCSPFSPASCAASATSNGAVTGGGIICPLLTIVAGLTTLNGPARRPRRSPLFNGCSRPTRQH